MYDCTATCNVYFIYIAIYILLIHIQYGWKFFQDFIQADSMNLCFNDIHSKRGQMCQTGTAPNFFVVDLLTLACCLWFYSQSYHSDRSRNIKEATDILLGVWRTMPLASFFTATPCMLLGWGWGMGSLYWWLFLRTFVIPTSWFGHTMTSYMAFDGEHLYVRVTSWCEKVLWADREILTKTAKLPQLIPRQTVYIYVPTYLPIWYMQPCPLKQLHKWYIGV